MVEEHKMKSSELVAKIEKFCKELGIDAPNIVLSPQFKYVQNTGKEEDRHIYTYHLIDIRFRISLDG